jgi:hypothetical protein
MAPGAGARRGGGAGTSSRPPSNSVAGIRAIGVATLNDAVSMLLRSDLKLAGARQQLRAVGAGDAAVEGPITD